MFPEDNLPYKPDFVTSDTVTDIISTGAIYSWGTSNSNGSIQFWARDDQLSGYGFTEGIYSNLEFKDVTDINFNEITSPINYIDLSI